PQRLAVARLSASTWHPFPSVDGEHPQLLQPVHHAVNTAYDSSGCVRRLTRGGQRPRLLSDVSQSEARPSLALALLEQRVQDPDRSPGCAACPRPVGLIEGYPVVGARWQGHAETSIALLVLMPTNNRVRRNTTSPR